MATQIEELLSGLGLKTDDARAKALKALEKALEQDTKAVELETWREFHTEAKDTVVKAIRKLAQKHSLDLIGRRVIVEFPKDGAEPTFSQTLIGKQAKGSGNGSKTNGCYESNGAKRCRVDSVEYKSVHAAAVAKGWVDDKDGVHGYAEWLEKSYTIEYL